jgi:branched-chain amino acid aminotransferase
MRGTHASLPDPRNEDCTRLHQRRLLSRAEAKISGFDSGFLVGDGVWEGCGSMTARSPFWTYT